MNEKLPQSLEAEEAVLGLMMISKSCLAEGMSKISEEHFHKRQHRLIFKGIKGLFELNKEISLVSLSEQLKSTNSLEAIGGQITLADLLESSISDAELNTYLGVIEDKSVKRKIILAADTIMKQGYEDRLDPDEFLKLSMEAMWQATPYYSSSIRVISSGQVTPARMQVLKDRMTRKTVEFGWPNLDEIIVSGMPPGDISILAARPGMGKSSLKTGLIHNLLEKGHCVVTFALEQGFATEQDRLEAIMTGIPLQEIIMSRDWKKGDYRISLIKKANKKIDEEYNYHIVPSRGIAVADVRNVLYRIAQKTKIDVVFFDLFDKLTDVNVATNKAQIVGVKLGEMSRIAQEFNAHICNLVQINRAVEKRANKRPKMSDLKDSGSYDEVARLILLLYREKYYFEDSLNDELEVIVAKQSNGPLGRAVMTFNDSTLGVIPAESSSLGAFDDDN
jgi:replicative DNA helicase